jgi:hypothetical protein
VDDRFLDPVAWPAAIVTACHGARRRGRVMPMPASPSSTRWSSFRDLDDHHVELDDTHPAAGIATTQP